MGISKEHQKALLLATNTDGNPDGKGAHGFLDDWRGTQPSCVIAKPQRQVLAELFTSLLVLSSTFKYRPVPGCSNYLYWIDEQWSLSLIAPQEWSYKRRDSFAGTCTLQRDMTWTIVLSNQRLYASALSRSVRAGATLGNQASISCRQWRMQLPHLNNALLAYSGEGLLLRK